MLLQNLNFYRSTLQFTRRMKTNNKYIIIFLFILQAVFLFSWDRAKSQNKLAKMLCCPGRIDKSEKTCENRMVAQDHRAAPKNKEV